MDLQRTRLTRFWQIRSARAPPVVVTSQRRRDAYPHRYCTQP